MLSSSFCLFLCFFPRELCSSPPSLSSPLYFCFRVPFNLTPFFFLKERILNGAYQPDQHNVSLFNLYVAEFQIGIFLICQHILNCRNPISLSFCYYIQYMIILLRKLRKLKHLKVMVLMKDITVQIYKTSRFILSYDIWIANKVSIFIILL